MHQFQAAAVWHEYQPKDHKGHLAQVSQYYVSFFFICHSPSGVVCSSPKTRKCSLKLSQRLQGDRLSYMRNSTERSASLSPANSLRERDPITSQLEARLMSVSSLWFRKHVRKAFRSSQSPTCAWYSTGQTNFHSGVYPGSNDDLISSSRHLFSSEKGL